MSPMETFPPAVNSKSRWGKKCDKSSPGPIYSTDRVAKYSSRGVGSEPKLPSAGRFVRRDPPVELAAEKPRAPVPTSVVSPWRSLRIVDRSCIPPWANCTMLSFLLFLNHFLETDGFRAAATRYCNAFVTLQSPPDAQFQSPRHPGVSDAAEPRNLEGESVGDGFSFLWSSVRLKSHNAGG